MHAIEVGISTALSVDDKPALITYGDLVKIIGVSMQLRYVFFRVIVLVVL